MFILYTDREGGEWLPWNTPVAMELIRAVLPPSGYGMSHFKDLSLCPPGGYQPGHICVGNETLFVPYADVLPPFHSILLSTAARWDATNRQWTFYICGDGFKEWWETYIANFKPEEEPEEREYWWLDQGPGWSLHGAPTEPRPCHLNGHGKSLIADTKGKFCDAARL